MVIQYSAVSTIRHLLVCSQDLDFVRGARLDNDPRRSALVGSSLGVALVVLVTLVVAQQEAHRRARRHRHEAGLGEGRRLLLVRAKKLAMFVVRFVP